MPLGLQPPLTVPPQAPLAPPAPWVHAPPVPPDVLPAEPLVAVAPLPEMSHFGPEERRVFGRGAAPTARPRHDVLTCRVLTCSRE